MSQLSDRGRGIWEQISEGEKEAAARAFDRLGKEEQRALAGRLDSFDRDALREGYEEAIDRDAPEQGQTPNQHTPEQTEGNAQDSRDKERGGQSRGRGRGGRGR